MRCVEDLCAPRTTELLDHVLDLEKRLHATRHNISNLVHAGIGGLEDRKVRRRMLKLRRDLFNLRPWPDAEIQTLAQHFQPDAWTSISAFHHLVNERRSALEELRQSYEDELAQLRLQFRESLRDPDFQKGLLLSSPSLYSQLARYLRAGVSLNGKLERVERGLLRYCTRMAMKATPFGRFCTVVAGQFSEDEPSDEGTPRGYIFNDDPRRKKSFVRLNKRLYGVLLAHLVTRPAVRRCLPVELNPTLREEGDQLLFLSSSVRLRWPPDPERSWHKIIYGLPTAGTI